MGLIFRTGRRFYGLYFRRKERRGAEPPTRPHFAIALLKSTPLTSDSGPVQRLNPAQTSGSSRDTTLRQWHGSCLCSGAVESIASRPQGTGPNQTGYLALSERNHSPERLLDRNWRSRNRGRGQSLEADAQYRRWRLRGLGPQAAR
jgi:hypothetical protein